MARDGIANLVEQLIVRRFHRVPSEHVAFLGIL
jgi:hypothetical protein